MSRYRLLVMLVAVTIFIVAGQVFAGSFNLTIPGGGGKTSTNNEPKAGNCTLVGLTVTQTGGNFVVNAGAQDVTNRDIAPYKRVTTGSAVYYPETIGNCGPGALRHIQFGTDINSVAVQIAGGWAPG